MGKNYKKPVLPASTNQRWGKAGIQKGWLYPNYKSDTPSSVYIWALLDDCTLKDCPLYDDCPYTDRIENKKNDRKCSVQSRYLKIVFRTAVGKIGNMMDDDTMLMIGLELIPLYNQLLHLKIEDRNIGGAMYKDVNGVYRTNPTYREMRDVMKEIRKIWKEIEKLAKKGRQVKDVDSIGDNSFIEALSHDTDDEENYDPSDVDPAYQDGEGVDFDQSEEKPTKPDARKRAARTRKKMTKAQKQKQANAVRRANGNKSDTYVPPYANWDRNNNLPRREDGTFMTKEEIENNLSGDNNGSEEN